MGGIVTKTVTPKPTVGNPQQRTVELPGVGMLNSIGLQNPGLDYFLETEAPTLQQYQLPVVLSISAHSPAEFVAMAEKVLAHSSAKTVTVLELNLSCPNVEKGGVEFGSRPDLVKEALKATVEVWKKPLFAKLTPNVGDMVPIAGAAIEGGATGLTAINTLLGTSIDLKTQKAVLPRVSGGYSGPGIKPVALHHVYQLYKHFPKTPIMGVGGVSSAEDALEFMMAGASLVQVGTSCFRHPGVFAQVLSGMRAFCAEQGVSSVSSLTGVAH